MTGGKLAIACLAMLAVDARADNFEPLPRGFALEAGFGLAAGTSPASTPAFFGSLFGGFRLPRVILGLGLQLNGSTISTSPNTPIGGSGSSGTVYLFMVVPGVRARLFHSADQRFEVLGEIDVGAGGNLGDTGPGSAGKLGLPPGSYVPDTKHFVFALGPAIHYWLHPRVALNLNVLARGDLSVYDVGYANVTRFDFNVAIGLGLLAVL
jgi:hypothetical protein